jgi:hypothetical protein
MDPLTGTPLLLTFNQLHNTPLIIIFYDFLTVLFPTLLSSSTIFHNSFPPPLISSLPPFSLPLSSFLSPLAPPSFPISPRHSETGHARGRRVSHHGGPHRLHGTYSTVQYSAAQYSTPSLRGTPLTPPFSTAQRSTSLLPYNQITKSTTPILSLPFPHLHLISLLFSISSNLSLSSSFSPFLPGDLHSLPPSLKPTLTLKSLSSSKRAVS